MSGSSSHSLQAINDLFGADPGRPPEDRIGMGLTYAQAAQAVGINEGTIYKWKQTNREFAEAMKSCEAESVKARLKTILDASEKSWQAAAWWLERRYPEQWGRRMVNIPTPNEPEKKPRGLRFS